MITKQYMQNGVKVTVYAYEAPRVGEKTFPVKNSKACGSVAANGRKRVQLANQGFYH